MNLEDYEIIAAHLVEDEIHAATQVKVRVKKIMNKLFPWPWWSKKKNDFADQTQKKIGALFKENKLPSEILAQLNKIEAEIKRVL